MINSFLWYKFILKIKLSLTIHKQPKNNVNASENISHSTTDDELRVWSVRASYVIQWTLCLGLALRRRDHLSFVGHSVQNRHYSLTEVEVSLQTILCFLLYMLSVLFQSIIFRSLCNIWNNVNWFCYYLVSYSSSRRIMSTHTHTTHALTGSVQWRNTTKQNDLNWEIFITFV